MTAEERLARLEIQVENLKEDIQGIGKKVDELVKAAHMGRGAWWLLLRIGVVLATVAGAIAWLIDKVK
jgi:hypothetical protein